MTATINNTYNANTDIIDWVARWQEIIGELNNRITKFDFGIANVNTLKTANSQMVSGLNSQYLGGAQRGFFVANTTYQSGVSALQGSIASHSNSIATLSDSIASHSNSITTLSGSISTFTGSIASHSNSIAALTTNFNQHHANTSNPHSVTTTQIGAVPTSRTVTAGGLVQGGGALSGNITLTVAAASNTEYRAGSNTTHALTTGGVWSAAKPTVLTDGANVAVNMDNGLNFQLTLGGNRHLDNPTGAKPGQSGFIRIKQDATGNRTLSFGVNWVFAGNTAPTLSTDGNIRDYLSYVVYSSTEIWAALANDVN